MTEEILNYYRLLEIDPGATPETTRNAYREMVKVWHPDRFENDPVLRAKATEKLKLFNLAFEAIKKTWSEPNKSARNPISPESESFTPLKIDKFRYYGEFVDELNLTTDFDTLHSWPSSISAAPTVEFIKLVEQVFGLRRRFSISLLPRLSKHSESLSALLNMRTREIRLSTESCSIKAILFFLFLLYFRDGITSKRTPDLTFANMVDLNERPGEIDPCDPQYLKAEWQLCSHTAEELMHRLLNSRGTNGTIRQSSGDFMGRLRLKWGQPSMEDKKRFMASRFLNDPSYEEMHSQHR